MVTSKNKAKAAPAATRRVFWKPHEQDIIVKRSAELIFKGERGSPLQAMMAAQEVLPEDRRRPNLQQVGAAKMPWFHPALQKELAKLKQKAEKAEKEAQAAAQAAAAPVEPVAAPTHLNGNAHAAVEPVQHHVATEIGQAFLNLRAMLVDELASVFVEAALKAIGSTQFGEQQVALQDAVNGAPRRIVFKRPNGAVRKPGILIAGIKDSQRNEIIRDYGQHFDLRFISIDQSKDQLRSMAEGAETTIAMTDHLSHSHVDIVKARSPNPIYSPGGLTQLRETLAGLAH